MIGARWFFDRFKNFWNVDIKDGVQGKAVVLSATVPTESATATNVKMWLDVYVEGWEPCSPWPSTSGQPQVINLSGAQLSGDLNQQIEQAMQLAQQAMQQAQQEQGTAGSAPAAEPPAPGEPAFRPAADLSAAAPEPVASVEEPQGNMVQERLAQLERLAELRDKGALTDAVFEVEKAKVLGGG